MTTELPAVKSNTQQIQTMPQPFFPTESDWRTMLNMGLSALKSGMLPKAVNTPEAAAIIFLKGREIGMPYMVAVAHIHIINGKPTMSAEMMQSLARKNLPGLVINILKSDDLSAEIEFTRPERGSTKFVSKFTIENAKTAQLTGKEVWKQYPAAMLFSRAISAGLRKICPDALMGISYTPEELGANTDHEGNVIETTGRTVPDGGSAEGSKPVGTQPATGSLTGGKPPEQANSAALNVGSEIKTVDPRIKERGEISFYRDALGLSKDDLKSMAMGMFGNDSPDKLSLEQLVKMKEKLKEQSGNIIPFE